MNELKNIGLLCRMAVYIKDKTVNQARGVSFIEGQSLPGCLMRECYKGGLISQELAFSIQYPEGAAGYFGGRKKEWRDLIYLYGPGRRDSLEDDGNTSGLEYYKRIEALLSSYGHAHRLDEIEGGIAS